MRDNILSSIRRLQLCFPGPKAELAMKPYQFKRTAPPRIFEPEEGDCAWCNASPIPSCRKKYCSTDCVSSLYIWTAPQSPTAKGFILIERQDFACAACGLDWSYDVKKRMDIARHYRHKEKFSYGYLMNNTGHLLQVDHIIPIHLGGDGIGLGNVQVICAGCHLRKSASERKKK